MKTTVPMGKPRGSKRSSALQLQKRGMQSVVECTVTDVRKTQNLVNTRTLKPGFIERLYAGFLECEMGTSFICLDEKEATLAP